MTEFALILPVFLLVTMGIVDMARLFNSYISLTNAATEGTLFAAQRTNYLIWCANPADPPPLDSVPCPGTITGLNKANFASASPYATDPGNIAYHIYGEATFLDTTQIDWYPTCISGCGSITTGSEISITATYTFEPLLPILKTNWFGFGPNWSNGIPMSVTTRATIVP